MNLPKVSRGGGASTLSGYCLMAWCKQVLDWVRWQHSELPRLWLYPRGPVAVLMGLAGTLYACRVLQRRHGEMFALDYVNENATSADGEGAYRSPIRRAEPASGW